MSSRKRREKRHRDRAAAAGAKARSARPPLPVVVPEGRAELFRAGRGQVAKVRLCQVLGLLLAPFTLWGAYEVGLNPAEILDRSGEVVPWAVRYIAAAFFIVVGIGAGVGSIVYGWCYITHAVWDPETERCRITLAGLFIPVRLDVPRAHDPRGTFHRGVSRGSSISVNAPYYSVPIPGRRLPLILDLQGELSNEGLLHRVLLGARR